MKHKLILILILLFFIPVTTAEPIENFSCETGSTYIHCNWDYNTTDEVTVIFDGVTYNTTKQNNTGFTGLDPTTKHTISLVNSSNTSQLYSFTEERTFYPIGIFYLLLTLATAFLILTIYLRWEIHTYLFAGLTVFFSYINFTLSFSYHLPPMAYIAIGEALVAVIWGILVFYSLIEKGFKQI